MPCPATSTGRTWSNSRSIRREPWRRRKFKIRLHNQRAGTAGVRFRPVGREQAADQANASASRCRGRASCAIELEEQPPIMPRPSRQGRPGQRTRWFASSHSSTSARRIRRQPAGGTTTTRRAGNRREQVGRVMTASPWPGPLNLRENLPQVGEGGNRPSAGALGARRRAAPCPRRNSRRALPRRPAVPRPAPRHVLGERGGERGRSVSLQVSLEKSCCMVRRSGARRFAATPPQAGGHSR